MVERLGEAGDDEHGALLVLPIAWASIVTVMSYETVLNAYSRNGTERMPLVTLPRAAESLKVCAPGAALPNAIGHCPRGMVSVRTTLPVAGSHDP